MRMPGLLLVPLAVALFVSGAHARPSASGTSLAHDRNPLARIPVAGQSLKASAFAAAAAQDVQLLADTLEGIHPGLFENIPRKRFRAEVDRLTRSAPTLTADELLVGVMRIAALPGVRNGHTGVFPLDPSHRRALRLYPVRLYDFADGLYVVDAADEELVGSRLVSIEGVPIAHVLELVRPLVPRDNPSNLRGWVSHYALVAEVLDGLGIGRGVGLRRFGLEKPGLEPFEVVLTPRSGGEYVAAFGDPLHGHYPATLPQLARPPLYLAQRGRELWMTKIRGGRAVYVGYNAVTVPTSDAAARLTRLARSPEVRRIVVDLRFNGGGDNTTYGPLLAALDSRRIDRRGRLYLLIGRATFSAAGNFVTEVERDTRAISVGEPTGGGVNIYAEAIGMTLPTLGWNVRIAGGYVEKGTPSDRRLTNKPDLRIELESSDFFAGRDPVLERALEGL